MFGMSLLPCVRADLSLHHDGRPFDSPQHRRRCCSVFAGRLRVCFGSGRSVNGSSINFPPLPLPLPSLSSCSYSCTKWSPSLPRLLVLHTGFLKKGGKTRRGQKRQGTHSYHILQARTHPPSPPPHPPIPPTHPSSSCRPFVHTRPPLHCWLAALGGLEEPHGVLYLFVHVCANGLVCVRGARASQTTNGA